MLKEAFLNGWRIKEIRTLFQKKRPLFEGDIREFRSRGYQDLYSSFRWKVPREFNIGFSICCRHQSGRPERTALYYDDAEEGREKGEWSFKKLHETSNMLANMLSEMGVKKGHVLAVCLPQRRELVATLVAGYKLGGIILSLTPLFGIDAILYRLRHSEARVLVVEGGKREVRRAVRESKVLEDVLVVEPEGSMQEDETNFNDAYSSSSSCQPASTKSDEASHLFYTSGTTGPPKGVLHSHRFLIGHLPCYQLYFEMAPQRGDVFHTPADPGWIGAIGDVILPSLYFGRPVILYRRGGPFNAHESLAIMERYKATCAFIPPTALRIMRKAIPNPRLEYDLKLRVVSSAGESVGSELIEWGKKELGVPINEFFGCTEANLLVVSSTTLGSSKPGAIGRPCPGHLVEIIDEGGHVLPPRKIGFIAVKSPDPVIFMGYYKDPEATQRKFIQRWFVTGDLGYKDEEGYLWFVSRADDIIKTAGYRLGPDEIELAINQHPVVADSGVVAVADQMRGNIVKAYVVLREGVQPSEKLKEEIQNLVRSTVASYAYPREVEFVDQLPRTTTGKLQRFLLRRSGGEKGSQGQGRPYSR